MRAKVSGCDDNHSGVLSLSLYSAAIFLKKLGMPLASICFLVSNCAPFKSASASTLRLKYCCETCCAKIIITAFASPNTSNTTAPTPAACSMFLSECRCSTCCTSCASTAASSFGSAFFSKPLFTTIMPPGAAKALMASSFSTYH